MNTTNCIDWLSLSGTLDLEKQIRSTKFKFKLGMPVQAIKRYQQGFELKPAGTLFISGTEKQGSLLTLTGGQMQTLRDICHDDGIVLSELLPFTKCSRIDFAVDIYQDVKLIELETLIIQEDYYTKFKSDPLKVAGISGKSGYTLYFGSPKSERRIRVYDKAAELKLLNLAWSRVELQNRKKRADLLARDMNKGAWQDVGKASIRDCLNFPTVSWWVAAVSGGDVPLSTLPRKLSKFENWLEFQVKPAIEKRIENGSNIEFIRKWLDDLAIS